LDKSCQQENWWCSSAKSLLILSPVQEIVVGDIHLVLLCARLRSENIVNYLSSLNHHINCFFIPGETKTQRGQDLPKAALICPSVHPSIHPSTQCILRMQMLLVNACPQTHPELKMSEVKNACSGQPTVHCGLVAQCTMACLLLTLTMGDQELTRSCRPVLGV
jgi:hypothetical protein